MSRDLMPHHALPGECVYCLRSVERGREAARTLKSGAVVSSATCLRCERALMRGDAPPVAVACPTCRGTGRERCPECHGDPDARAAVGCEKTHHSPEGEVECTDCDGRGMLCAGGSS